MTPGIDTSSRAPVRARQVAALVDRVTFSALILETGTQSYRLAASMSATTSPGI
ncbi:MAG TPA: hypothetical protein VLM11_19170 [Streptosporangiaceae bacterium]|nr:hypothetical protein [Streptosporangiaceae bacterium]